MKTTFVSQLTDISAVDLEGVGNLRYENDKVYRWVQNTESSTALTVGQVCCHTASGGATATQTVKIPLTANLGVIAGIIMATSLTAQYYGWIQVSGPGSVSVSGATTGGTDIAAGDYLKAANSAAYMVRDAATGAAYNRNVQALVAIATTTTPAAALKACLIRCLN